MILKRYSSLRILYNDMMRTITIKYADTIQGKIPLFVTESAWVKAVNIIRTSTDELIVIVNENLYNKSVRGKTINKDDYTIETYVIYSIVAEVLGSIEEADKYMAGWIGFNKVINLIKRGELGDNIRYRVRILENSLLCNRLYNDLPKITEFLDHINFVGVENQ